MAIATGPFTVSIPFGGHRHIEADLHVPGSALGLVIFAHGSGSSRFSARNQAVADALFARGLGTMLVDLLTHEEESVDAHTGTFRFDVPLLAERVEAATAWAQQRDALN